MRFHSSDCARRRATRFVLVAFLFALQGCATPSAGEGTGTAQRVSSPEELRWTSMEELRAMTKAGNYHLIRTQKIGCLIRLEGYLVSATPLDCTVRVGRSGAYPAFLYNTDAFGTPTAFFDNMTDRLQFLRRDHGAGWIAW